MNSNSYKHLHSLLRPIETKLDDHYLIMLEIEVPHGVGKTTSSTIVGIRLLGEVIEDIREIRGRVREAERKSTSSRAALSPRTELFPAISSRFVGVVAPRAAARAPPREVACAERDRIRPSTVSSGPPSASHGPRSRVLPIFVHCFFVHCFAMSATTAKSTELLYTVLFYGDRQCLDAHHHQIDNVVRQWICMSLYIVCSIQ